MEPPTVEDEVRRVPGLLSRAEAPVLLATLALFSANVATFGALQAPDSVARALDCGGHAGEARTTTVRVRERGSGASLSAQMWAPDAVRQTAPCPVVSLLPGGGAAISSVEWAATRLAVSGYVVIVTLPSQGASAEAYHRAAMGSIDFLESDANPYRRDSAIDRVSPAGRSAHGH